MRRAGQVRELILLHVGMHGEQEKRSEEERERATIASYQKGTECQG